MLDGYTNKYFCTGKDGKDLFYISLDDLDLLPELHLSSSLGLNLLDIADTGGIIQQLRDKSFDYGIRAFKILELFSMIQKHPGIENYYFPEFTLNPCGKYLDFYERIGREFLNEDLPEFTPIRDSNHPFHFQKLKQLFSEVKRQGKIVEVETSHFEELLPNNPALQEFYVELYSPNQKLYFLQLEDSEFTRWDFYCQVILGILKLVFIRKSPNKFNH